MDRFQVRPPAAEKAMSIFSGGNQQKVLLARWLETSPKVLVLHEPTQGVDAGVRKEIFNLVTKAAEGGVGIVLVSSDFDELAHVCHRVFVLRHGRVNAILSGTAMTEDGISKACQGV